MVNVETFHAYNFGCRFEKNWRELNEPLNPTLNTGLAGDYSLATEFELTRDGVST